jgi:hypothetical protein
MKTSKTLLIVAIFGLGLFTSCTPESIETNEQQIDLHTVQVPRQG